MATLRRAVYLDGVYLAEGTELTDEQAKRITNPNATEDRSIPGQDGTSADDASKAPAAERGTGDGEAPARRAAAKPANR
jgi:hypothetical protein